MLPEDQIHAELASFGPEIIAVISSTGFFDQEGPYEPLDMMPSGKAKARYVAKSQQKNSRVWDVVKASIVPEIICMILGRNRAIVQWKLKAGAQRSGMGR